MLGINQLEKNAKEIIEWLDTHPGGLLFTNRAPGKSYALCKIFARGPWQHVYLVCREVRARTRLIEKICDIYTYIPAKIVKQQVLPYVADKNFLRGLDVNVKIYSDEMLPWYSADLIEHKQFAGGVVTSDRPVAIKQFKAGYDPNTAKHRGFASWEVDVES